LCAKSRVTSDVTAITALEPATGDYPCIETQGPVMGYFNKAFIAASIAFALVSPIATPAVAAASSFDGAWSVHIASSSSECGNGQTVSIGINNGQVTSSMVSASGRVADAGNISVTLASGIKKATGFGHLSGTSGSGTWRGALCSGTWTASRD